LRRGVEDHLVETYRYYCAVRPPGLLQCRIVTIKLHVLGADPSVVSHRHSIAQIATAAIESIRNHLPISGVDVVIQRNPRAIIPELGIGGFAPSGHLIHVSIDPEHANFHAVLDRHLSRTLAHELHHCARWRGPGYGRTLGEALVSEGLADHFDLEVHQGSKPYHWTQALDAAGLKDAWELARPKLWDDDYDHDYWFFNTSPEGPPFHTGYSLGFYLVGAWLEASPGYSAARLATAPAQRILTGLELLPVLADA